MTLLSSNLLSQYLHISAHFTTRHGGISSSPYDTFNLAFHVGDNPRDVLKNHHILADKLGYDPNKLIHMRQIHSNTIIPVNPSMNFDAPPQCDALITNHTDMPLMVMSADCTPILLYDPVNHAIGAVHAGRAGALNRILPLTLEAMQKNYNTAFSDIQIVFGPSIQGCCYEINESIAHEVKEKGYEEALIRTKKKVSLEVNMILHMQLKELGIESEQIESINQCTACNSHDFFSYRADAQHTGRIAGVILLRSLPS
jgi:YfiH family protein